MQHQVVHPGAHLFNMLNERGLSQRELASKINIAHSLLNNILKGNRNINVSIALSLEAAGFENAKYWMTSQIEYLLDQAKADEELVKRNESIKLWNDLSKIVPVPFFKKQNMIQSYSSNDVNKIYKIYNVNSLNELKIKIEQFIPANFRKSTKFIENRNNVIAWSLLADYKAKKEKVNSFYIKNEYTLIEELNECFYTNKNTLSKTKKILNKYGIKFFILDRPPKTPIDGKSFMSDGNPAIVLSLKYKRLDNFAFNIMHEIGHIFMHIFKPKNDDVINTSNTVKTKFEEFEADNYAKNKLLDANRWDEFFFLNNEFPDSIIFEFSKKFNIHPAIIRGRVCFEKPEYYRKRSLINRDNIITD